MSVRSPGLALSLSASRLGFHVHAGFLAGLTDDLGIRPGFLAGSSSGAFVGGLFASGIAPGRIHEAMASRAMRRCFWEWRGPLRGVGMALGLPGFTGMLTGWKLKAFLRGLVGDQRIEDCPDAELTISVTNLTEGHPEILRSGDMIDAILASCSVPILFRTVASRSAHLWDGAIADSSPLYHLADDSRVTSVLVHAVAHERRGLGAPPKPWTISRALGEAHQIVSDRLLAISVECALLKGRRVTVLTSIIPRFRFSEKGSEEVLYAAGRDTVLSHRAEIFGLLGESKATRPLDPLTFGTSPVGDT